MRTAIAIAFASVLCTGSALAFDANQVDPQKSCVPCNQSRRDPNDLGGCEARKEDRQLAADIAACMSLGLQAQLARDPRMIGNPEAMGPEAWRCMKRFEEIGGETDRMAAARNAYKLALENFYKHLDARLAILTIKLARDPKHGLSAADREFMAGVQKLRDRNDRKHSRKSLEAELKARAERFGKQAFKSPKTRERLTALGIGVTPDGNLDFRKFAIDKVLSSKAHAGFIRAAFGDSTLAAMKRVLNKQLGPAVRLGNMILVPGAIRHSAPVPRFIPIDSYNVEATLAKTTLQKHLARYSELVEESRTGRHRIKEFGMAILNTVRGGMAPTKLEAEIERVDAEIGAVVSHLRHGLGQHSKETTPMYQAISGLAAAHGDSARNAEQLWGRLQNATVIVGTTAVAVGAIAVTGGAAAGPLGGVIASATSGAISCIVLGAAFDTAAAVGETGLKVGWDLTNADVRCRLIGAAFNGMLRGAESAHKNALIGGVTGGAGATVGQAGKGVQVLAQNGNGLAKGAVQVGAKLAPTANTLTRLAPAAVAAWGTFKFGEKQLQANVLMEQIHELEQELRQKPNDPELTARLHNRVAKLDEIAAAGGTDLGIVAVTVGGLLKGAYDRWKSARSSNLARNPEDAPEPRPQPAPGPDGGAHNGSFGGKRGYVDKSRSSRGSFGEQDIQPDRRFALNERGTRSSFGGERSTGGSFGMSGKFGAGVPTTRRGPGSFSTKNGGGKPGPQPRPQEARRTESTPNHADGPKGKPVPSKSEGGTLSPVIIAAVKAENRKRQIEAESRYEHVADAHDRAVLAKIHRARTEMESGGAISQGEKLTHYRRALNLGNSFARVETLNARELAQASKDLERAFRTRERELSPDKFRSIQLDPREESEFVENAYKELQKLMNQRAGELGLERLF